MHRTALARTERRTRSALSPWCPLRTRTLKNRLAGNWASGRRTGCSWSSSLSSRRCRTRRRSFVHGTRTGLRNDHARSGRLWRSRRSRRRSRTRCSLCDLRNCRSTHRRRSRRGRCDCRGRGRSRRSRRSGHGWRNRGFLSYRRSNWPGRRGDRRGGRSRGRGRRHGWPRWGRRRNCRLRRYWRRGRARRRRNRRSFLLLSDGPQHISGAGDMR
jgi:hypothetical protein